MVDVNSISRSVVYVVGDDSGTCRQIADLVRSYSQEVQLCGSTDVFLEVVDASCPGCVVLDSSILGVDLLDELKSRNLSIPVLVLTNREDTAQTVKSLLSGAFTLFEKPVRDDELLRAIQEALQFSKVECERQKHVSSLESRLRQLAPQDRAVLQLMLNGVKNRTIAKRLEVSLRTVENRRRRVFDVMQADSVAQLTRMVVEYEYNLTPSNDSHDAWLSLPFEKVAC